MIEPGNNILNIILKFHLNNGEPYYYYTRYNSIYDDDRSSWGNGGCRRITSSLTYY
jgi:hypothetical protein